MTQALIEFQLDTSGERWLPVVGYEGAYEVSDLGRVRSLTRAISRGGRTSIIQGRVKTPKITKKGYAHVHLFRNDVRKCVTVHRIVAEAFIPNAEQKPEINHQDNDRRNNAATNLKWCTRLENQAHAASQVRLRGTLSAEQIDAIRAEYPALTPAGKRRLAASCKISVGHIHKIGRGAAHRHCDNDDGKVVLQ